MHKEPTKAVIYCRVSDKSQDADDAHGLQSQEIRLRDYAKRKSYDVVATFHDDISGKYAKRPALSALLDMLRRRKRSHIVLIDSTTRLARSPRAHLKIRDDIASVAYRLESPTKVYADDPEDDPQEMMEAVFSGFQRKENAVQTKNRMHSRKLDGFFLSKAPVGYKNVKIEGRGKVIVRDEPTASIVTEALEGYAGGRFATLSDAQLWLANCPDYPERRRRALTRGTVQDMLKRSLYAGYLTMSDGRLVRGQHEALISFETYQRIKDRMAGRANAPARKNLNLDFPLRGAILCTCDRPLMGCWSTSRNGQRHAYYLCQNKGNCEHYGKSIRRDVIESEFAAMLDEMRPSKPVFAIMYDMLRDIWDSHSASAKESAALLKADLKRIEREVGQFLDRIVQTNTPALINAYEDRIRLLEEDKIALREKIANCGRVLPSFDAQFRTAMEYLGNPQKLWVSDRFEDKRAVLKMTFAHRLIYARGEGFRTRLTSPFQMISDLSAPNRKMVPLR